MRAAAALPCMLLPAAAGMLPTADWPCMLLLERIQDAHSRHSRRQRSRHDLLLHGGFQLRLECHQCLVLKVTSKMARSMCQQQKEAAITTHPHFCCRAEGSNSKGSEHSLKEGISSSCQRSHR